MRGVFLLTVVFGMGVARGEEGYARPELLVEPGKLASAEPKQGLIVLDVRSEKKYRDGHVPGAQRVEHAAWVKAFGDGTDAEGWGRRLGALGIGSAARVVLYDDTGVKDAAQLWWILRYWGVDARLLNGGWAGWKEAGHATETSGAVPTPVVVKLTPQKDRLATRAFVLAGLRERPTQLIDARSEREYSGEEKLARRGGTIPGALHREWTDLLDPKTQRFRSAGELKRLFEEAGVRLDKPAVAFCQSGRRSSVTVFALELLGAKGARNYFASWGEWGNAEDTPVVAGQPRKK